MPNYSHGEASRKFAVPDQRNTGKRLVSFGTSPLSHFAGLLRRPVTRPSGISLPAVLSVSTAFSFCGSEAGTTIAGFFTGRLWTGCFT